MTCLLNAVHNIQYEGQPHFTSLQPLVVSLTPSFLVFLPVLASTLFSFRFPSTFLTIPS